MKVVCSKENLLQGIQTVQRVVSNKNPLPILGGIKFYAAGDQLTLTATDLEIGIECSVPVTVLEKGNIVIPARYLSEMVRRLPDTKIEIEVNESANSIDVKYGKSEFSLNGYPAQEFPSMPDMTTESMFNIQEELLRTVIRQVTYATSNDDLRPVFSGVLLECESQEIRFVATDTHRLALRKIMLNNQVPSTSIIIPGKALNEVGRLTGASEQEVAIHLAGNQIFFNINNVLLVSRLIEGNFPNYHQVIPQSYKTRFRIRTRDLLDAAERASLLARDGVQVVKLTVQDDMVIVTAVTEVGRIHEEVTAFLEGEAMQVSFNARYLCDVLRAMDSEEISFELTGSLSPGIVRPMENDDYISLLLPVRTV